MGSRAFGVARGTACDVNHAAWERAPPKKGARGARAQGVGSDPVTSRAQPRRRYIGA